MIAKTIREYYLLSAMTSAANGVISAMYVTFLLSHGLNLFEANLVNVFFYVTLFIFEIPTGAFADVFGRKASFIASCFFMVISGVMYALSDSFWGFVVAEMIGAFGSTFASGAFRAWFVDRLDHHGHVESRAKIFSRCALIRQTSNMSAAVCGAYIASTSMLIPWMLSAVLFGIAGCIAFRYKEEYFVRKTFSFAECLKEMKEITKSSFHYSMRNANIRFVLISGFIYTFVLQGPNMQWQPFFQSYEIDVTQLGFIKIGISISLMIGTALVPYVRRWMREDERRIMNVCQIVVGLSLIAVAQCNWLPAALAMFMIHEIGRGVFQPITETYLHANIASAKDRATIDSFSSLVNNGGGVIGLVMSGGLALHFGIGWSWGVCGSVLTLVALILIRKRK